MLMFFLELLGILELGLGAIRDKEDIIALLENLNYAYHKAKIAVLEEELALQNIHFEAKAKLPNKHNAILDKAYKIFNCGFNRFKIKKQ